MSTFNLSNDTLNSFNLGKHLISSLIVICGKVKSGKTTLIANILNSIKSNTFEEVLYFNEHSSPLDITTKLDSLFKVVFLEDDDTFAPVKRRIVIIDGVYNKMTLESLQLKRLYAKHKYMGITFIHSINHIDMLESFMLEQIDYFFLFKEIYTCYQQTIFRTIVQQYGYVLDVNLEDFLSILDLYTLKQYQCLVVNQTLFVSELNLLLNYYYTPHLPQPFKIGNVSVDEKQNISYNNSIQIFNSFPGNDLMESTNVISNNNLKDSKKTYVPTNNTKKYNISSRSKIFTKKLPVPNTVENRLY